MTIPLVRFTARQGEMLAFIQRFTARHGVAPSFEEIASDCRPAGRIHLTDPASGASG